MNGGRLVFPGPQGIVVQRADGRLVLLPARAAAGSRGRRGEPRLLPELPGRPLAVGFEGRWTLVTSWRDGESLQVRIPPRSDEYELRSLGSLAEPAPGPLVASLESEGEPVADGPVLCLGGREPLTALEVAPGTWAVSSQHGEAELQVPAPGRVVSPARVGLELGLAILGERELSFQGAAGTRRRTMLGADPEEAVPCAAAPWLALLDGDVVSLRDLGSRWGRRLGLWRIAQT